MARLHTGYNCSLQTRIQVQILLLSSPYSAHCAILLRRSVNNRLHTAALDLYLGRSQISLSWTRSRSALLFNGHITVPESSSFFHQQSEGLLSCCWKFLAPCARRPRATHGWPAALRWRHYKRLREGGTRAMRAHLRWQPAASMANAHENKLRNERALLNKDSVKKSLTCFSTK
jgi:hypothetical protein